MPARAPAARLVVDADQRIVEFDHGAEVLLCFPRERALGRLCYEVVRGGDRAGSPVCGPGCPGLAALRGGKLRAAVDLHVPAHGRPERLACRLTALPEEAGGAVVSLTPRGSRGGDQRSVAPGPGSMTDDLAALATVMSALAGSPVEDGLQHALELVREATGADVAELFLTEPSGRGLVLTCHAGTFRQAFTEELRFGLGEGFPGRVLASGAPLFSRSLQDDDRYLRERVKEAGFTAYACAPLHHAGKVVGSIGVASRAADPAALEHAEAFLRLVGAPIGTAVQAAFSQQLAATANVPANTAPGEALVLLLEQMIAAADADAGEVRLLPVDQGSPPGGGANLGAEAPACLPLRTGRLTDCPVLGEGHGVLRCGRPASWPTQCRAGRASAGHRMCVPLEEAGAPIGVVSLWQRHAVPLPSKDLVKVETLAVAAGRLAAQVRAAKRVGHPGHPEKGEPAPALVGGGSQQPGATLGAGVAQGAPRVHVRCFGPFRIWLDGAALLPQDFGRRKALTLLKVLIANHGRTVAADALIEALWPGANPATKTSQLHVLVHVLRKLLEAEESAPASGAALVVTEGDGYAFVGSGAWIDKAEFRTLAAAAVRAQSAGRAEEAIAAGEAAVALYRGDFMEDEPYADWCWQERETLRETCLEVAGLLAGLLGARSGWERAVRHLRLALRLDPLREALHRDLMHALWAGGRRDEALHQFILCEELLARELGVGPLPETVRLADRIRELPGPG